MKHWLLFVANVGVDSAGVVTDADFVVEVIVADTF